MAGKGTIGGKIVLEGESQYRAALKNIKSEQAELRSEMKLCQTAFKDNQNSADALGKKYEILTKQVDSQSRKVKVYEDALMSAQKTEEDAAKKVSDLQAALQKAEKEMDEMSQSSGSSSEALEEQSKAVEELKNKLALAEQDYDKAAQKTTSYQTSLNYANAEMQSMQQELSQTGECLQEAKRATGAFAASIDEYSDETVEASQKTNVFGDVLKANLLSEAITSGIAKLADGIRKVAESATDAGTEFEASMSQVAATMGMTAEEVADGSREYTVLADAAKKCGKETMFSASQAGEALNYLALAGYDAEKSAATLPKVLDLAAAGGLDLAYASDLVTDSMAALGMESEQLDNYIDQMARTSQKSNTSVAQLGEATLVCAGTVSLTGQSLETMNTELGILANNGIKGAEGGTHLRNVLLSLSAPTEAAEIALHDLGVKVSDSNGNMRDLNDILIDLDAAMTGMSSTEKTRMINRIFNKTDIASVNALLKGTGDEFDNLRKEIENSSGAAATMAETLNDNLKGKVTILQSALEGLGISAYEIFDDGMKASVESATEAVTRLQKSIDNGDLGVSMRKLSKSFEELVKGALGFGEDALPEVIDGLAWVLDNADLVVSGIAGIAAANVEMKVVVPVVESVTGAWQAYKTANEGATVTQWLLNAAMDANPAGILITAITGLTAAVAAYAIMNKDNIAVMDETVRASYELVQASEELNKSYEESASERAASRQEMETEAGVCRSLVQELSGLQTKTTLTTQEQARQKAIVGQLNQVMPELNLAIDEQTGLLNMSTKEIEHNIDALMAQAKAEAAKEDAIRIEKEQLEAKKQLTRLNEQLEEQTRAAGKAYREYNDALRKTQELFGENAKEYELYGNKAAEAADALELAREAQASLKEQMQATQATIDGLAKEYELLDSYISDTEPVDTASGAMEDLGDAAAGAAGGISGLSETAQRAYSDMYESASESISAQMDLFSKWDEEMVTTGEGMVANMQSQIDGLQEWSDNIKELADRGISRGLLQKLADMGPEGAGYVAAFVDMTDEELKKANELYAESLSLSDDVAVQVAESYAQVAENAVKGLTEELAASSETIEEAGENMGKELSGGTEKNLIVKSPSKKFKEIGEFTVMGLIEGVIGERARVYDTVENLARSMVTISQEELDNFKFAEIGQQIPKGLAAGIEAGAVDLKNVIQNMCTDVIQAAKESLGIHSPSKEFAYLGKMSGEGYLQGLEESMVNVNAIIAASMPDASMRQASSGTASAYRPAGTGIESKKYDIHQNINIYAPVDDMVETSRKFKEAQQEAAREW